MKKLAKNKAKHQVNYWLGIALIVLAAGTLSLTSVSAAEVVGGLNDTGSALEIDYSIINDELAGLYGSPVSVTELESQQAQVYLFVNGYGSSEPVAFDRNGNTLDFPLGTKEFTFYIQAGQNSYWANTYTEWNFSGGLYSVGDWFTREVATTEGSLNDNGQNLEIVYPVVDGTIEVFFGGPFAVADLEASQAQVYLFADGYGPSEPVLFNSAGNLIDFPLGTKEFTLYLEVDGQNHWSDNGYPWELQGGLTINENWFSREVATSEGTLNDDGENLIITYPTVDGAVKGFFGGPFAVADLEASQAQVYLFADGYGVTQPVAFAGAGNTISLPLGTKRFNMYLEVEGSQHWADVTWPWALEGGLTLEDNWFTRENIGPTGTLDDQSEALSITYPLSGDNLGGFAGGPLSVSQLESQQAEVYLFVNDYGLIGPVAFDSAGNTIDLPFYVNQFNILLEVDGQQYWAMTDWPWELAGGLIVSDGWFSRTGLIGSYYKGTDFNTEVFSRVEGPVDFDWSHGSPGEGIGIDKFSVRWTGKVMIPSEGLVTFYTYSDDGNRLYIDDTLVVDDWSEHAGRWVSGSLELTTGLHDIRFEYYDYRGRAAVRLGWNQEGEIIPQENLIPSE